MESRSVLQRRATPHTLSCMCQTFVTPQSACLFPPSANFSCCFLAPLSFSPPQKAMPNPIPDFQIQNFLARHTIALPLSSVCPQDSSCPICRNTYSPPPASYVHPNCPSSDSEYACEVQLCKHVFGRCCLEKHLSAGMPWSHTCPLCRMAWLNAPNGGRREVLDAVESALSGLSRIEGVDADVRSEIEGVEEGLRRIRNLLERNRWI